MSKRRSEVTPWYKTATVLATVAVPVLVALIAAFLFAFSFPRPRSSSGATVAATRDEIDAMQLKVASAAQQVQVLRKEVSALKRPTDRRKVAAEVRGMREKVNQMDGDLSSLEAAILRSPAKAIELPLMRRDLDNLRAANQASLAAVQQDLDRQYDLMKWIVGTFAVGIGGMVTTLVVSALKGAREASGSNPPATSG